MALLDLQIDAEQVSAQCSELLQALEGLPKPVRDGFLRRIHGLLADHTQCRLLAAPGTGDHVGVLQLSIPWIGELIAAARSAKHIQGTGHGGPRAK